MALPLEVSEDSDSKVRFEVGGKCVCVGLGFQKGFPDASPARFLVSGPASLSELLSEVPVYGGTVDWRNSVADVDGVVTVLRSSCWRPYLGMRSCTSTNTIAFPPSFQFFFSYSNCKVVLTGRNNDNKTQEKERVVDDRSCVLLRLLRVDAIRNVHGYFFSSTQRGLVSRPTKHDSKRKLVA